jgi:hypothetical protein
MAGTDDSTKQKVNSSASHSSTTESTSFGASRFEQASAEQDVGIVREFLMFLKENKKWWLLPIILVMLAAGLLAVFSNTAFAPFIYALF